MARYEVPLNGAGPYYLVMYTSQSGRTVGASLYWRRDAYGYSSNSGGAAWQLNIAGVGFGGGYNFNAPGGGAIGETFIASAQQYVFSGSNVLVTGSFNTDVSPGSGSLSGREILGTIPPAPTMHSPDQITPTSMRIIFNSNGDGGSPITSWAYQISTDINFVGAPLRSSTGTSVATGLVPGTTYYVRARGGNVHGAGPWSNVMVGVTTALVAPGMSVAPNIAGTNATVTLTPPSGVSSVTSYRVERRLIGGSSAIYNTPTSPLVATGLTPGTTYEWRASAFVDSYQTPWTDWVTVTQPQPNTNPGDYFDGSTADKPDVDYQWTGTVNNSTSRAVAKAPAGWRSFAQGNMISGGLGVVIRATGGRSGAFGARVTFFTDTTAPGFRAGTAVSALGATEVAENGVYWGSVYVAPSRSQRMAAELVWLDAAYNAIGVSAVGEAREVAASSGTALVRLVVQGTAPIGAVYGAVGWTDVAGAGWSAWRGGDTVMMDDAMASIGVLYDWFSGNTPDSAAWEYSWLGAVNASVSMATAIDPDLVDPLADPDCPPIPTAPRPPVITDDCIDEVGAWRRYWAIIPADQVSAWLDLVPTIYLTTGVQAARQVRIRVYRNPDDLEPGEFPADDWDAEQIVSYMPPNTMLTLDGVAQRVWADVGGGDPISADRLLYGTGGGPATWPVLSCGTAYLISFDVPLDAPEGNLSVDVALTTRML